MSKSLAADPELWGGLECTVARVGDRWGDQCRLSGHHDREDDLRLLADIGFTAVRYPVLWERVAPDDPDMCDWGWTDSRLSELRALGIRPIAGLVHHGSGPRYTSLLDPDFPAKLGHYAGQAARRYPWIGEWTPVNEPLTTARFSALYGHWYPHRRDEGSFWTALVNQVDGVGHAMRAIRAVNPDARLIQTDDLGRTYATAPLFGQAAFDNLRRWAGWDLLFGRVTPEHPLWERMAIFGLEPRLEALAAVPCPPDVLGVNHYLTSDRFLDHRVQRYPAHTHGANYDGRYADVEAIRVLDPAPGGLAGALREAWERYGTPLAMTEVHLGCTREEQLRWIGEAWGTARALRAEGVDCRAVTAWAAMGSHGWNTLLRDDGVYEAGLFDCGSGMPRPTAIAAHWQGLASGAERHPVASAPGWWRRPARLLYPPVRRPARFERGGPAPPTAPALPLLIAGGLGAAFERACDGRHLAHIRVDRAPPGEAEGEALLERHRPWAVVSAGGTGADGLIRAAVRSGVPVLTVSVGTGFEATASSGLLVLADDLFDTDDPDHDVAARIARSLSAGQRLLASDVDSIQPCALPRLVDASLDLLIDGADGTWRASHGGPVSRAGFARCVARACGLDPSLVAEEPGGEPARAASTPERDLPLGPLDEAIARFAWSWARGDAIPSREAA